jgi:hypothetical protein
MILSPGLEKQMLVGLDDIHGPPDIPVGHPALGYDGQIDDIDPRFPVPENVGMRRLVVGRVDDKSHSVLPKNGDHR